MANMYLTSQPTATFTELPGWTMPSPQPIGSLKRPPILRNGSSSSSSLSGMEQVVPSFQSFIKRTPPVSQQKPLPPAPLKSRRASSTSPPRSRTPSSHVGRRSSSVYSRTVSQWEPGEIPWRPVDFAGEPLPPLPTLYPLAYSASTPQLVGKQPTSPLLQARTYSPLIGTPSPTASRVTTPSPSSAHTPSILLPSPLPSVQLPKKHLRTVSLEKAKAAAHAPGAVHLLPEELRAQTIGKSKSDEHLRTNGTLRIDSMTIITGRTPLESEKASKRPALVDNQGRQRALQSPSESVAHAEQHPFRITGPGGRNSEDFFSAFNNPEKPTLPQASRTRKVSRDKVVQVLGHGDEDGPRGRTRTRGPRNTNYAHYLTNRKRVADSADSIKETDAQNIAKEYQADLSEDNRKPSEPDPFHTVESDDSIKSHVKMVPRPLFQTKAPAKLPPSMYGSIHGRPEQSISLAHPRNNSETSENFERRSSGSSKVLFPFIPSWSSGAAQRRMSSSGSMPISPPTEASPGPRGQSPTSSSPKQKTSVRSKRGGDDPRVSAFYPHIASRKGVKARAKASASGSQTPPVPLLAADIIAQRLETPEDTPESSPHEVHRTSSLHRKGSPRRRSTVSSDGEAQTYYRRLAKGAMKYADLLTKPTESPHPRRGYQPNTIATVAPGSPHLQPSPVKSQPPARVRLGWSQGSKNAWDKAQSLVPSPRRTETIPEMSQTPQFTHVVAQARPLDETRQALRPEAPRRKGSLWSAVLDGWKESKAEKRRGELKKAIKVVPMDNVTPVNMMRRSTASGRI